MDLPSNTRWGGGLESKAAVFFGETPLTARTDEETPF